MTVDLRTTYLGIQLKNPLVVAACSLTDQLDNLRQMADAGAAAIVMHSLFEEQIEHETDEFQRVYQRGADSFAEALTYFPDLDEYRLGPQDYVDHVAQAKKAVGVPIIASLNGVTTGGWVRYAKMLQDAGADALELNVYYIAADMNQSGAEVEQKYIDLAASVKKAIQIPLAVKLGPFFSSPGYMARRLVEAGADGLVLFNRFLQPDFDLEELQVKPHLELSTPAELLLPLRWIAILHGRLQASLALTSGIHRPMDLVKAIVAGADVGMVASVLYREGIGALRTLLDGLQRWLADHEYQSVAEARGALSQAKCPDPTAFERGNYMRALTSFTGQVI
ncbi:MAG TPA: dihydroorotate dehydrogenase-like protein [Thermoguttaceae bacterium]|nr:dihydroorotate dehydrogenase-like protein [Thermoguttaceae bacterium]HPP52885.1 dihydroorotate dehydrogenase-like protein [Thermoguttaceae bacterium]